MMASLTSGYDGPSRHLSPLYHGEILPIKLLNINNCHFT